MPNRDNIKGEAYNLEDEGFTFYPKSKKNQLNGQCLLKCPPGDPQFQSDSATYRTAECLDFYLNPLSISH